MKRKKVKHLKRRLRAMAECLLALCDDEVSSITVHADNVDGMNYINASAWATGSDKEPLVAIYDFPEEVDA